MIMTIAIRYNAGIGMYIYIYILHYSKWLAKKPIVFRNLIEKIFLY